MNSDAESLVSPLPWRGRRWAAVTFLLVAIAARVGWWWRSSEQALERELVAKGELGQLGALTSMDGTCQHVNSVNLSTLKSPETLDRALALLADLPKLHSLNVTGLQVV